MMSKSERRAQLDKQVGTCPIEGSMLCQHVSYQAAHLTAVHQGCRCKGLQSAPELRYSAILLLDLTLTHAYQRAISLSRREAGVKLPQRQCMSCCAGEGPGDAAGRDTEGH